MSATATVLDASALLAVLFDEDGGDLVRAEVPGAAISTANWAEVVEKAVESNVDDASLLRIFEGLGLIVVPVDVGQAEYAARLRQSTRALGLSLADRLCFALAADLQTPVLTADRDWSKVDAGVEVRLIR